MHANETKRRTRIKRKENVTKSSKVNTKYSKTNQIRRIGNIITSKLEESVRYDISIDDQFEDSRTFGPLSVSVRIPISLNYLARFASRNMA